MRRKLPMVYSALLLTAVNLLLRLVGTGFQVYLSGRIGPAGIGLLQLVLAVSGLSLTAGIAGVRTAAMYLTAEEIGKKQTQNLHAVLSACFLYSILCSGMVSAALFGFSSRIAGGWIGDIRTQPAIRILACFLPVSCLCGVMTGFFTASGRIGILSAAETAEQICSICITVFLLRNFAQADPGRACTSVILGSSIGSCITLFTLLLLAGRPASGGIASTGISSRLLAIAVPLALADNLKSGISTAESLMVPRRLGLYPGTTSPLALFGMVCGMVFPVMMFPASLLFGLTELLIPELARCRASGSDQRIRYLTLRSLRTVMLYGFCCSGLLVVLSDFLCGKLYGSTDAASWLRIFSLLVPMLYCDFITDAMTKGLGQQKICVRYNIITSALDILFLYFLLPKYGMYGYFISFFLTHCLNFILSIRLLLKITRVSIRLWVPLAAAGSTALAAVCAKIMLYCKTPVFLAVYASMLVLTQVLSRKDWNWLSGLIAKK